MNKVFVLLACFVGLSCVFSQNINERKEIQSLYKKDKREGLAFDSEKYSLDEYQKAVLKAKTNGLPLTVKNYKGETGYLVRFDGDIPLYYSLFNEGAAQTINANEVYPGGGMGLSLTGSGMLAGVWDQNHPRLTHLDFKNTSNTSRILAVDGPTPAAFHSTHVTGTVLSNGNNSVAGSGRGIAYEAEGWIFDWTNDMAEMNTYAGFGLLVSNHSYGLIASALPQWYFGAYVSDANSVDNICFNNFKYMPVYAAGNDRDDYSLYNPSKNGNDLIAGDKVSKNALVVGAVSEVLSYINNSSVVMSSFSNYGPTDDFRIKPDLVSKGVNVYSTSSSSDTAYSNSSGTSMAAPTVTGGLILVQQYFGAPYLNASTLKGLALHTAEEAGPFDGPDHMFGWGLLNIAKMIEVLQKDGDESIVEENTLSNGGSYSFNVLALGTEPLKVSISWTDQPGTIVNGVEDSSTPVLVNDLDVRVIQLSDIFEPWKLNKDWNNLTAVKGDNDVDPFERVDVNNPSGVYQVVVNHKGSLVGGSQKYSLVVTGVNADPLSSSSFETGEKFFNVWLNKSNNVLEYSLADFFEGSNLCVYDLEGRKILEKNVGDGLNGKINVDSLLMSRGVYVVRVISSKGEIFNKKVVF